MDSVADELRKDAERDVSRLSVSERVALALALGEQAVSIYASANGVSREEARRTLRRNAQAGRRPSAVARLEP